MSDVLKALESERELEKEFVAEALRSETQPKGWPAALVMFHISMWRGRLPHPLTQFPPARPYPPPPQTTAEGTHPPLAPRLSPPPSAPPPPPPTPPTAPTTPAPHT